MIVAYRVRQGMRALFAFAQPVEDDLAARTLTPALLGLFGQMRRSEQQHSLRVLRSLQQEAEATPSDLATAALLHDVGKSRYPVSLWGRTLPVLVRAVSPALVRRLAEGEQHCLWRRPFAVYVHHPAWSGAILRAAGASEAAVWLAEHHADRAETLADHPYFHLLQRLQRADDTN